MPTEQKGRIAIFAIILIVVAVIAGFATFGIIWFFQGDNGINDTGQQQTVEYSDITLIDDDVVIVEFQTPLKYDLISNVQSFYILIDVVAGGQANYACQRVESYITEDNLKRILGVEDLYLSNGTSRIFKIQMSLTSYHYVVKVNGYWSINYTPISSNTFDIASADASVLLKRD